MQGLEEKNIIYPNGKADVRVHSCFSEQRLLQVRKLLFGKPEVKR
jgi:hypothetical protein